jgi:two-component system response regulator QseB
MAPCGCWWWKTTSGIAADGLQAHLGQHRLGGGHVTDSVATGWAALRAEPFDLVLLDLGLPTATAPTAAPAARRARGRLPDARTPVLIMTARDEVASRIGGLDMGADDYVTKPFDPDELAARMRALLRRAAGRGAAAAAAWATC